jgi:hypothetical protein
MERKKLRLYADFNSRTPEGACWILYYNDASADGTVLERGLRVILFQDEGDFEVEADIDFRYVDALMRDAWIALPDWPTLIRV